MAGRHVGWRRLRGDTDRPELLDVGKKLLGYLAEQRRLSGVKSCSIQRELPDGSIVRARYVYDHPEIEISTAPVTVPANEKMVLEGFVVWPEDGAWMPFRDFPELVLVPRRGSYAVASYDGTQLPEGLRTFKYKPVFPGTGIQHAGNVDWTNADETLSVTWYGPRSRYLEPSGLAIHPSYGYPDDRYVFCHGQVLVDLNDPEYVALLGMYALVRGAAIRTGEDGMTLVMMVLTDAGDDVVVLVDFEGGSRTAPILSVNAASARILDSRSPASGEFDRYNHPWFFNTDATEARCIRDDGDHARRLELVVAIDPNSDVVTWDVVEHPYPLGTLTTDNLLLDDFETPAVAETLGAGNAETDPYSIEPPIARTTDLTAMTVGTRSGTGTRTVGHNGASVINAVDYSRATGLPVYFSNYLSVEVDTGSIEQSTSYDTLESEITFSSFAENPVNPSTEYDLSLSGSANVSYSQTKNWANSSTGSQSFSYGDYTVTLANSRSISENLASSVTLSDSFSDTRTRTTADFTFNTYGHFGLDGISYLAGVSSLNEASVSVDTATASRSLTMEADVLYSETLREFGLLFADLRRDFIVYLVQQTDASGAGSYSHTQNFSTYGISGHTHNPPVDITTVRSHKIVVEQAGEVLFEHDYTMPGSVNTISSAWLQYIANRISPDNPYTFYSVPALPNDAFGLSEFPVALLSDGSSSSAQAATVATYAGLISGGLYAVTWPFEASPVDREGFRTYGAWAFYKDRFCFSFPEPGDGGGAAWRTVALVVDDTDPYAALSTFIDTHETAHPIWVLPPVRRK